MFFEKLPYESLCTSIYGGLDLTHGTNIDNPASTIMFYYDWNKVKRFDGNARLGASLIGLIMSLIITSSEPISFRLFFVGMWLIVGCFVYRARKGDFKSRMAIPGITVSQDGLIIVGSVPSVTPAQTIPWNAISSATVSKKISGCTIIEIFLQDSKEARMSVKKIGVPSYCDYGIKFLSNLLVPHNKPVSIFGDHLYVDSRDVVNIINERVAYYCERRML